MLKKIASKMYEFVCQPSVRRIFGIIIFTSFSVLLYFQLKSGLDKFSAAELSAFYRQNLNSGSIALLLIILFLMPLNWLFEVFKWRVQMQSLEKICFGEATKGVLAGLSVSLFTPNRIGEFGGKLFFVKHQNRPSAFFATIMGSLSQWLVIVGFGLTGLSYLFVHKSGPKYFQDSAFYFICFIGLLFSLALLFYFRTAFIVSYLKKYAFFRKYFEKLSSNQLINYSNSDLFLLILFSKLRYLIYAVQFYLLIFCFGFNPEITVAFAAITLIFLLQTAVPMPASLGLPARGSIAVFVFGWLTDVEDNQILALQSGILMATFLLWIINVFIPALFGMIFLSRAVSKKQD
jgi:hypothetical protein